MNNNMSENCESQGSSYKLIVAIGNSKFQDARQLGELYINNNNELVINCDTPSDKEMLIRMIFTPYQGIQSFKKDKNNNFIKDDNGKYIFNKYVTFNDTPDEIMQSIQDLFTLGNTFKTLKAYF